mgnify:CR=1 FL=1
MSGKHVAKNQPSSFEFSNENKIKLIEVLWEVIFQYEHNQHLK